MKTIKKMSRDFVISAAIAVMLLLPTTTNAQTRIDGFFNSSSDTDEYNNRTDYSGDVSNQTFGQYFGFNLGGIPQQDTPVGSGLIIMTIASASYVLLKKKED